MILNVIGLWIKKDPEVLPKGEKRAVDILAKTTKKENNRCSFGLLWKEDTITLSNNKSLATSWMISLEKKFDRQPELKVKYVETINQYIKDAHATKIGITKRNDNFNKKVPKTSTKYPTPRSDQHQQNWKNLHSLVGVLLRLRQGRCREIEKMFYQVMVKQRGRDALRFVWRRNRDEKFQDTQMNVQFFWKVDSPGCCIWVLNKTISDNIVKIAISAKESITDNFYIDHYLDSFHTLQEAIKVLNDVTNVLSDEEFRLTKWISNNQQIL